MISFQHVRPARNCPQASRHSAIPGWLDPIHRPDVSATMRISSFMGMITGNLFASWVTPAELRQYLERTNTPFMNPGNRLARIPWTLDLSSEPFRTLRSSNLTVAHQFALSVELSPRSQLQRYVSEDVKIAITSSSFHTSSFKHSVFKKSNITMSKLGKDWIKFYVKR